MPPGELLPLQVRLSERRRKGEKQPKGMLETSIPAHSKMVADLHLADFLA